MRDLRFVGFLTILLVLAGCAGEDTRNDLPVRCLDKPDPGPCGGREPRYYYDYRLDRCRTFHYSGCQGRVPFETMKACEEMCVGGTR
jgi:hypothetical protein